ncbi:hypothetical protein HMPREF9130_0068 [Peptoniphilus sp. oral taxon 375 str. F0436]|nr:hypothetical protein HMPREF9130_0068 [Peptoniphilus sp. oral taxon 375 str. F0436]
MDVKSLKFSIKAPFLSLPYFYPSWAKLIKELVREILRSGKLACLRRKMC